MIPAITGAVLYYKFHKKIHLWELVALVGIPVLLIIGSKSLVESLQTMDTEYWGGWTTKAEYYEDWNERVPCAHPEYRTESYTDSKGRTQTRQVYVGQQHAYDVSYHPEHWDLHTSNGERLSISRDRFEFLCNRFGSRKFVDLGRSYHTNDGDKYVTTWAGTDETFDTVVTKHSYENRVAVSDSVFNYPEVEESTKKDYGLYNYPPLIDYKQRAVLGPGGGQADQRFRYWNAKLGRLKQVKMFVCVYQGQPKQAALEQEALWKGGNKNEFIICVGIDKERKVKWSYVFSWSESDGLKVRARDYLMGQEKLDLTAYVDWLAPEVQKDFVRKRFADFAYLTVEPPGWAVFLVYLLTLLACGGLGAFVVLNEIDADGQRRPRRWRRGRIYG
jgi:hypothetical protein